MNYTQWYVQNGKFQKGETWLLDNLMLETICGSHAYGCQNEESDYDVVGIVLPKVEHLYPQNYGFILGFDQLPNFARKEMKGEKKKVLIGEKEVEAEWVSLIEFFVQAGLKGSPNLIETLFVRKNLVTVGTKAGWYLRDKRRLFLSMKTYHAFRGYAHGQMHRIRMRNPETDDRKALIEKYGYDCYIEETEFLTSSGWKKYEEISSEKLATVDRTTGEIDFQDPTSRIVKNGIHTVYEIENNFTKFSVTENHNILYSPCHRAKTLQYDVDRSNWGLAPIKQLSTDKRSWYHIRTSVNNNRPGIGKDLDELTLIGLYISEGSMAFNGYKIKAMRISQTKNGKKEVFDFMRRVMGKFGLKEYTYAHKPGGTFNKAATEETVWITHKKPLINSIHEDFGETKNKRYPKWVLELSNEEADALRFGMFIGDGTAKKAYNQEVYYSTIKKLGDLYQILALLSGYDSNVMGPYTCTIKDNSGKLKTVTTYQTLVNVKRKSKPKALCINTTGITKTKILKLRGGKIIHYKGNVVCFEVPNGTLVTRLGGKVAIQGNCKMAYHTLRLIDQLDQILTTNDIDLMRNKEECKLMRKGEWGNFERFDSEFQRRMTNLDDLVKKCNLSQFPNHDELKVLLQEILEEHYGSLGSIGKSVGSTEYVSAKDVMDKLNIIEKLLSE